MFRSYESRHPSHNPIIIEAIRACWANVEVSVGDLPMPIVRVEHHFDKAPLHIAVSNITFQRYISRLQEIWHLHYTKS
jgi:hypothetical protein